MKKLFFILLIVNIFINDSFTQNEKFEDGKTYKHAKIYLSSGETIKCKSLSFQSTALTTELSFIVKGTLEHKAILINEVDQIKVTTKRSILYGGIAGLGFGVGMMFIVKAIYEKPKTTYSSGPGWTRETTITKIMPTVEKAAIIVCGTALGVGIGALIKRGWEKIYPSDKHSNRFTLEFHSIHNNDYIPGLALKYRF